MFMVVYASQEEYLKMEGEAGMTIWRSFTRALTTAN
jgi:hypothetical protein